ncbi:hypothetical protein PLEOSDRAFT_1105341 [Pleurotus ostreatus PC15]|uniref:Uncharacterized protein n=1 Tax=Pleurotus ostreatus (strain PC15) TaxID=1137138 RepID=A0A067NQR0_PLEO1|nr:hypothetical protein PLEOSDRAFT_1105341 [Pleurotus ostreatus PC15]
MFSSSMTFEVAEMNRRRSANYMGTSAACKPISFDILKTSSSLLMVPISNITSIHYTQHQSTALITKLSGNHAETVIMSTKLNMDEMTWYLVANDKRHMKQWSRLRTSLGQFLRHRPSPESSQVRLYDTEEGCSVRGAHRTSPSSCRSEVRPLPGSPSRAREHKYHRSSAHDAKASTWRLACSSAPGLRS